MGGLVLFLAMSSGCKDINILAKENNVDMKNKILVPRTMDPFQKHGSHVGPGGDVRNYCIILYSMLKKIRFYFY